jgi:hypothetical protein
LDYYFEEVQRLCFKVYDLDNDTPQVSDDDFLGQIECTLGEVCFNVLIPCNKGQVLQYSCICYGIGCQQCVTSQQFHWRVVATLAVY